MLTRNSGGQWRGSDGVPVKKKDKKLDEEERKWRKRREE